MQNSKTKNKSYWLALSRGTERWVSIGYSYWQKVSDFHGLTFDISIEPKPSLYSPILDLMFVVMCSHSLTRIEIQ